MNKEIKKHLDSANFKFKEVDENGVEEELTLSDVIQRLMNDNKQLEDYITNLQTRIDKALEFIEEKRKVFEWYDTDLFYLECLLQGSDKE